MVLNLYGYVLTKNIVNYRIRTNIKKGEELMKNEKVRNCQKARMGGGTSEMM